MPRFEVDPAQLGSGGANAGDLALRLGGLRGRAAAARSGASSAGTPAARTAVDQACSELSQAIDALERHAQGLGAGLSSAAGAYTQTDISAMPGGSGADGGQ